MLKRIGKRLLLIAAVVVVLLVIVGVGKTMLGNYVSIRGQHLNKYSSGSGGGMSGGYYRETVKRYDDYAVISIESAEWHSQDPTITEYRTDAAVMDELEAVVRKEKMNFWNRKKFTKMFIADGESESYDFDFDHADISFSSQIYPLKYRKKLEKLDSIVKKYLETAEKLPGLVNTKTDDEEYYYLPENELIIYVYSYVENSLGLRILNGTDEEIELAETYKIINADTGAVLFEDQTQYGRLFGGQTRDEKNIRLKERLDAGSYQLVFGDLIIPFEIR